MPKKLSKSKLCRNKVVIEISVEELITLRSIFGGLKSREGAFKDLLSAIDKHYRNKKLTSYELVTIDDAVNYPENFSNDFKKFFDNYDFIHSLFSYSDTD